MAPIAIGVTSLVYLIFRSVSAQKLELLLGDFKRLNSKAIVEAIIEWIQKRAEKIFKGNKQI